MKNKTAEEVYVEMLKPAETVTLKVQHRPDDFNVVKDISGDGFYIRYVLVLALNIRSRKSFVIQVSKKGPLIFPQQPHLFFFC